MTRFRCAECNRVLYTSERDFAEGQVPGVMDLIPGEGMPEPSYGLAVECPDCGPRGVYAEGDGLVHPVPMTTPA